MTEFTRDGITAMLNQAEDVPMLDIFGGENWTPDTDHRGHLPARRHEPLGDLDLGPEGGASIGSRAASSSPASSTSTT